MLLWSAGLGVRGDPRQDNKPRGLNQRLSTWRELKIGLVGIGRVR